MTAMKLCRLSRREAQHLMLAPAVAGGWVAVHPDCRDAVAQALGFNPSGRAWADCLALLPAGWDDALRRPVEPATAQRILARFDHATRYPVVGDEVDSTPPGVIAERVRAHLQAVTS